MLAWLRSYVNPFQCGNLIRREAIRLLAPRDAARQVARGFEIAAARIVDQPILQTVLGVALLIYLRRQQPQLRRGKRIRVQSLHPVGAR